MNCKFCNNFIPDEAKICPICGKNVEEEALVKVETEEIAVPAEETVSKPEKTYKKKSLLLPLIIILISAAAFFCIYTFGKGAVACDYIRAIQNESASETVTDDNKVSDSEVSDSIQIDVGSTTTEEVDEIENKVEDETVKAALGANGVAGLIGLAGIGLLGKRVSGNRKAKRQAK